MRLRTTVILLVCLVFFATLNSWAFHGAVGQWLAGTTTSVLAPVGRHLPVVQVWWQAFLSRRDLASENVQLQDRLNQALAQEAHFDALQQELAIYQAAHELRDRMPSVPIVGALMLAPGSSGATQVVVNRGARDGVASGDLVTTTAGAMVGVVRTVFADHALADALGGASIQVAARIQGTDITGLVRADRDGLFLDLVNKSEAVTEGETVITSGNDHLPAGFIIGTIRSVDNQSATLFSLVRVSPVAPAVSMEAVFVVHQP